MPSRKTYTQVKFRGRLQHERLLSAWQEAEIAFLWLRLSIYNTIQEIQEIQIQYKKFK
jgi:hypothetical protein